LLLVTAPPAHSADLVTELRAAVAAILTDLLSAEPDPRQRAYAQLASVLTALSPARPSTLAEATVLIGAACEHAQYCEYAEARLLMVAGQRVLRALEPAANRIPPGRVPLDDLLIPVRTG